MSNNNPHSHINQTAQNSSWNPLQIPSYIPRQPQLAHMSNERPMVRSPLAWHAAAPPPESLYNFMSAANHKNLEHSMNPLLPPYVRGPPPFDSMDLSLQSNRSTSSPLNKNAHSLIQPPPPTSQLDFSHKQSQHQHNLHQHQTQQQMHSQNNYPIHNLSTSSSQQSQQHTPTSIQNLTGASAATTQSSPAQNTGKFLNSNGSDCEQPTSLIQTTQASTLSSNNGGSYQRHSAEGYGKISHINRNFENDTHSKTSLQKPVELVSKDCSYATMISNKLPSSHLLQQSSKKHSPVRGGSGGSASYHIPQSPQQSPFNSPAPTGKHNGPHTPPTPHSPGMHQTQSPGATPSQQQMQSQHALMHSSNANASVLDYNQLHLQQPHNSYSQTHLQQHLHHSYPQQSQHHQHWQQQQQQPPPPNVVSLPSQNSHQTVPAHMQSQQLNSPHHSQQTQSQQSHQKTLANIEAKSPTTAVAVNTESNFGQRSIEHQTTIVPSPAICVSPKRDNRIPDSAQSPDTNASSNDDDSYDEKIMQSKQHPKKSPQSNKEYESPLLTQALERKTSHTSMSVELGKTRGISKSPKNLPSGDQRKSPQKLETDSPESLDLSPQRPVSLKHIQSPPSHTKSPLAGSNQRDSETESAKEDRQKIEIIKNGCTPPEHSDAGVEREVETIDKIAEMIAKTASNSSHNSNSNDANSNSSSKSARTDLCDSPKTKKQRQALKLRNAEHNTDWSGNSYHDSNASMNLVTTATTSIPLTTNDDNAVLADELGKGTTPPQISPRKRPMSPQTNSRSSSSSSSSSSCSNSSHSSCGSKAQKLKPSMTLESSNADGSSLRLRSPDKENVCEGDMVQLKIEDNHTTDNQPLNLNCKTLAGANSVFPTPASPDKSSFEEVENKLEEMFAGIEDETPPENKVIDNVNFGTPIIHGNNSDAVAVATDLSVALELSNSLNDRTTNKSLEAIGVTSIKTGTPPQPTPIQTKAAKKSTVPSPVKLETPEPLALESNVSAKEVNKSTTETTVVAPDALSARKPMPRRRLSVALDPSNLRIMLEGNEDNFAATQKRPKPIETNNEVFVQLVSDANTNEDNNKTTATDKGRQNKGNKTTNTTNTSKVRTGSSGTSTSNTGGSKSTSKTPAKKNKQNQQKQAQQKRRKQSSSDEDIGTTLTREITTSSSNANSNTDRFKSPFVLIKRDGSVTVVNAATAEDNGNDKQTKTKKPPAPYTQHERRNIRGFHSSTLSQKYDADTTDSTWICVFCKRGPHRMGLGDLFGPYLVTVDCEEYRNAVNAHNTIDVDSEFISKRRRIDMVQCNARGPPVVPATKAHEALAASNRSINKKKKKSLDESHPPIMLQPATTHDPLDFSCETYLGMNKVSENSYEVWLHEDCTVWAPDVFLVGARIMGLDGSVWNSTRYQCVLCEKSGATVCCLERECKAAAHVPCAREALWRLNESNWHVHCHTHIKPNSNNSCSSNNSNCLTSVITTSKFIAQNPSTSIS